MLLHLYKVLLEGLQGNKLLDFWWLYILHIITINHYNHYKGVEF